MRAEAKLQWFEESESRNQDNFLNFKKPKSPLFLKVWFWRNVRDTEKSRDVCCGDGDAIPCPTQGWAIHRREPHLITREESGLKDGWWGRQVVGRTDGEKVGIVWHHCFLCEVGIETTLRLGVGTEDESEMIEDLKSQWKTDVEGPKEVNEGTQQVFLRRLKYYLILETMNL